MRRVQFCVRIQVIAYSFLFSLAAQAGLETDRTLELFKSICDSKPGFQVQIQNSPALVNRFFKIEYQDFLATPNNAKSQHRMVVLVPQDQDSKSYSISCLIFQKQLLSEHLSALTSNRFSLDYQIGSLGLVKDFEWEKVNGSDSWLQLFLKDLGAFVLSETSSDRISPQRFERIADRKGILVFFQNYLLPLGTLQVSDGTLKFYLMDRLRMSSCLELWVFPQKLESHLVWVKTTGFDCALPQKKKGTYLFQLADIFSRYLSMESMTLQDSSSIACRSKDHSYDTPLRLLSVWKTGETWYQRLGAEAVLKASLKSSVNQLLEIRLDIFVTYVLKEEDISDEDRPEILGRIEEFKSLSSSPWLKDFFAWLWDQDCYSYVQLIKVFFFGAYEREYPWAAAYDNFENASSGMTRTYH